MKNATCNIEGCTNQKYTTPRGKRDPLCGEHKNERQREWYAKQPGRKAMENNKAFAKAEGHIYLHSNGYYLILGFSHPASNPSGLTSLHRIIMWDKLDGEDAKCAECGGQLHWFSRDPATELAVDHVDGVKTNNHPSNLEPVHVGCNVKRAHRMRAAKKAAALAQSDAA